ncbi:MAG TPA: fibrillarin-like rRNA/tRNA 2'-O-methyltransferase [Candidatus Aenigmarchaeota archaeon]|nr:MAG: fibrillarin-like rRNA/tRNA 2'-O-methyltransferase [Candidatus Aenigmarchaeota archaeon]HDD46273.1 fibrillarin-like rRNA/tRNA 2'-O-methyltransferase [Candidatus Aenigmarchaeota archaeon]
MKGIFGGVWKIDGKIFTKSLIKGEKIYTEKIIKKGGEEFREWSPYRSKLAAAIMKGLKIFPIKNGCKVLYLGVASGTTASFISDIIGRNGIIYGVDVSERSLRELVPLAEKRKNIVPILANAKLPEQYWWIEKVDIVYEDVASDDQSEIMIRNAKLYLKKDGYAMIAIKARSIDVTDMPENIYASEERKLSKHFVILEKLILDPYEKDHAFFVMKKR